jgi:D-alanyl-D-alanine carboxypeptidase
MTRWAADIAGLAPGEPGLAFANHSGLTLESRAAPAAVVALLAAAARHPAPEGAAHPRLPGPAAGLLSDYNVAAESVPLDYDRLDVVAKTGTMDQVRGLAGYIATPKGRRLVFAIFSNRLEARAEDGRRFDRYWMARARNFERALIRNWVGRHDAAAGGG